jgi:hypothetical protein
MKAADALLATVMRQPALAQDLPLDGWELLIRQARRSGLLARLSYRLDAAGALAAAPGPARPHFEEARVLSDKHARDVRWEVRDLRRVLAGVADRPILLKGAAYAMTGLPPAEGRVFADIDVLVPRENLAAVERRLRDHGWGNWEVDAYDDRYYRRFTHQIPPLTHFLRGTTLDVHHAIVQPSARDAVATRPLLEAAQAVPGEPGLAVLQPTDMVLHSAAHLFNDGEFNRGLRDLDDLNLLLRHFGAQPAFWPALLARAEALGLMHPLAYALRYTAAILATPVPPDCLAASRRAAPGTLRMAALDRLFGEALAPDHPSCRGVSSAPALWLLYVRAHYLRMPLHLLVPHLLRKALRTEERTREASVTDANARLNLPGPTAQSRGHG